LTRQDGVDLPSMEEQREEGILRVEDAMRSIDGRVVDADKTIEDAAKTLDQSGNDLLLVKLSPSGWGSVSRQQLLDLMASGNGPSSVGSQLKNGHVPFLHPDHSLDTALRYVDRWPLIPVVSRADFRQLEGVITQRDVLERYREFGEG